MIGAESARQFFRFVMTRDIDWSNLEGLIEDFACGVDPYVLNREPVDFQYLRLLVDGSHWNGQKKMKKPDTNGGGGHLGCSTGFNFNLYKEHLEREMGHSVNSQGREQGHSLLDKCTASLRQKSYSNFMKWLSCFFCMSKLD